MSSRRSTPKKWAVVGSSGFVGSALTSELRRRGYQVVDVSAPRLTTGARGANSLRGELESSQSAVEALVLDLQDADFVVNAAGMATPDSPESDELFGANALLPIIAAKASQVIGAQRYVHLSSAAVQGNVDVVDSSPATHPFSPYSRSKAVGEQALLEISPTSAAPVIIRATSVQGPGRATTRNLQRIARSRIASVASPGNQQSVVSSIDGLIDFVIETGLESAGSDPIMLQPWEGGTVSSVLKLAGGGKEPTVLPAALCRSIIRAGTFVSALVGGRFAGAIRRVELMWFGQAQEANKGATPDAPSDGLRKALSAPSHDGQERSPMKIGMVTQWFDPETGPAALPGVYAREMCRQGHAVSVLTGFPNYPDGQIYPGFEQSIRQCRMEGDVQVTRVPLYPNHGSSAVGRIANYLSFALSGTVLGVGALRKSDAVWVYNSPVTVSLPLFLRTGFGRTPYFLHVQDLWPDSLINSGMLPEGVIGRFTEKSISMLVRWTERRATAIGVISPSVKELILSRNPRLPESKIVYVPNPTDEMLFGDVRDIEARDIPLVPWSGKFVFMYLGAMGEAQGLDTWLDAARSVQSNSDIAFVFIGEGTAKERLLVRATTDGLKNVYFHDRISKNDVPRYMATSTVQIVSLGADDFLRYTTPSKISSILASRLPVLAQIGGDGAALIARSGAGLTAKPGDAAALVAAVVEMAAMSTEHLDQAAQRGLDFYRENMSAKSATQLILSSLQSADSTKRLKLTNR